MGKRKKEVELGQGEAELRAEMAAEPRPRNRSPETAAAMAFGKAMRERSHAIIRRDTLKQELEVVELDLKDAEKRVNETRKALDAMGA